MSTVQSILDQKGNEALTVAYGTSVLDAARMMNERQIGSLVVTHEGQVCGIITERDILRRLVVGERDARTTAVGEIMTREITACQRDTPLCDCRSIVTSKRIRHLPVIEQGRLKGIITIGDLVKYEIKEKEETIGHLHEYLYQGAAPSS